MVNYNTWEQFTPFTLGLDETLNRLETFAGSGTNYPPYNIYNGSDSRTILEVALAGFSKEDISVTTERNCLTVAAKKANDDRTYSHKGISNKAFSRNWQLGDDVEIEKVDFINGLLTVILVKELPEKQKKKVWM